MGMISEKTYTGEVYHIFTRSIAGYKIFNTHEEYLRMTSLLNYYKCDDVEIRFSMRGQIIANPSKNRLIKLLAYCTMPTHVHLVLKQCIDNGIPKYINKCLNSYTRYFNIKHKRKGPLWESRFKRVLITNDDLLEHIIRYVHLNPSTAGLVLNPIKWEYSSYKEYVEEVSGICDIDDLREVNPTTYRSFVESQIGYQRELSLIKHLMIE